MWIEFLKILKEVAGFFSIFINIGKKLKLSLWKALALVIITTVAIVFLEKSFATTKEYPSSSEPTSTVETTQSQVTPGELRIFGTYANRSIIWEVLDIQDDQALLVSKYALVIQPYHSNYGEISWEKCSLRNEWLNGTFLRNSFTGEEQKAITGEISLLTLGEVLQYFPKEADRICVAIPGAQSNNDNGVRYGNDGTSMRVCWWLRGTEGLSPDAPYINFDGEDYSNRVANNYLFVRPAMWVDLNKIDNQWERA